MKKMICLILASVMMLAFAACGGGGNAGEPTDTASATAPAESANVTEIPETEPVENGDKETLVCGVTEFEPMNFQDENGNWTGFDTEFAQLVGEKLGMDVEFQQIAWAQKFTELNAGTIDAIWNGFTATSSEADGTPRTTLCDMSYSYMENTQCVVVKAENSAIYTSAEALADKTLAAESGSAGESMAAEIVGEDKIVGVLQQINTLLEVLSGAADGAVIDVILANQLVGSGDYADLAIAFELDPEVYAIGFRTGDTLRDRVNEAMLELYDEGKLQELAEKYGFEGKLIIDKTFGQ